MVQAEVTKTGSETTLATIRKFSRRVQGAGVIKTVRGGRYFARPMSKAVKKKRALKLLKKRKDYARLVREGKMAEPAPRMHAARDASTAPRRGVFGESTPIAR